MFARLRRNLVEKNYAPVALELLVVVFGILIAFQIDRWAENRREREQEYEYLVRLKEDLQNVGSINPSWCHPPPFARPRAQHLAQRHPVWHPLSAP